MAETISFFFLFKYIFLACMPLLIEQLQIQQETGWERGGVTHSKGPKAGTWTQGHCSEDEASVQEMLALPTELNHKPQHQLVGAAVINKLLFCNVSTDFFIALLQQLASINSSAPVIVGICRGAVAGP